MISDIVRFGMKSCYLDVENKQLETYLHVVTICDNSKQF